MAPKMTVRGSIGKDPPERCDCARIRRAARNVTRFYDVCLAPAGITASQLTLLGYLKHRGPMRMGELAELLGMDRATLGHNLCPLERDGLLHIVQNKDDRRARVVEIAAAGLTRVKKGRPRWDQAQHAFERALGRSKAADMRRMINAVAEVRPTIPS